MEEKTNYTIVGLIVLILLAALVATGLWLSIGFDQKKYHTYAVYIREAVSGLSEQSPVKFNGVKVGYVSKIELNHHDPRKVEILLSIEDGTPITTSTTATLISQGITGTTYVGLAASSSELTPLQKAPNQPYPVIPAKPSLFNQLDKALKDVSENVNKVSDQIGRVFNEENINNLNKTLANVKKFTDVFAENSTTINHSLENMDTLLKNTAKVSDDFPQIVKELKQGIVKLNDMTVTISDAGTSVSSTMTAGKSTIDKLSEITIPSLTSLIHRLNLIAINLEKVSIQVKDNPSVLIRGTEKPPLGPGE